MNPNVDDTDVDAGRTDAAQDPVKAAETAMSRPTTEPARTSRPSSKTPLFEAFNAARYQRQSLIQDIQAANHRTLLSYVAGPGAPVERDDALAFVDLLHPVPAGSDIDLILHTGGGDIDVTEKLANMLWAKIGAAGPCASSSPTSPRAPAPCSPSPRTRSS